MAAAISTQELLHRCQACHKQEAIYQCPRCAFRSCSLKCCKAHKEARDCNGKRDRIAFLPLNQMDDGAAQSDYFFLEDVLKQVQTGKQAFKDTGGSLSRCKKKPRMNDNESDGEGEVPEHVILQQTSNQTPLMQQKVARQPVSLPQKWRCLRDQASQRGVKLIYRPPGMARHKNNRSFYHKKRNCIVWTVECVDHRVGASRRLQQLEETQSIACLDRNNNDGADANTIFLIKKLPCRANNPLYVKLSPEMLLSDAIRDMTIYDFPTLELISTNQFDKFPVAIESLD